MTTPVENLLGKDGLDLYMRKVRALYRELGQGVHLVQWTTARLGKPNRTFKGEFFYRIWEGPRWSLYVANRKGFCFEVLPGLSADEAFAAFEEILEALSKLQPHDPKLDPREGDVLELAEADGMRGGKPLVHHLTVVERFPRRVSVLDGNWTKEGGGILGGSPFTMPLGTWRQFAERGTILVTSEEGHRGWDAVRAAWNKKETG